MRYWFDELDANGSGPDWVLNAAFAPASPDHLTEAVRSLALQRFTRYHAEQRHCAIHNRLCSYDLYIDDHSSAAVIAMLEGRVAANSYLYHTIQVCQHDLQIVRGYGGYPGQYGDEETRCIRTLALHPELQTGEWSIAAGGDGYPFVTRASGDGAATVVSYLDEGRRAKDD